MYLTSKIVIHISCSFEPIKDITAEIKSEENYMRELISHSEMCDEKSNEELRKVQATYDETVRQHTDALDAQNEELSREVNELAAAKQELADVEGILKQKQNSIAELQNEMKGEICLLEEQRQTLAVSFYFSFSKFPATNKAYDPYRTCCRHRKCKQRNRSSLRNKISFSLSKLTQHFRQNSRCDNVRLRTFSLNTFGIDLGIELYPPLRHNVFIHVAMLPTESSLNYSFSKITSHSSG